MLRSLRRHAPGSAADDAPAPGVRHDADANASLTGFGLPDSFRHRCEPCENA